MRAYFMEQLLTKGHTHPMSPQKLAREGRLLVFITRVSSGWQNIFILLR